MNSSNEENINNKSDRESRRVRDTREAALLGESHQDPLVSAYRALLLSLGAPGQRLRYWLQ